mmetsp:Transcript_22882/g.29693  ORF Transcript_22882/g.29693 Transcript_22882/m.29693 type:complete len:464 (-) Transcript_22882:40-1431(-)
MKIIEKQPRKVVISHSNTLIKWAAITFFGLTLLFLLLDAKHPKASLSCVRHKVDATVSDLQEDNDCELVVRPTRTVFDTHTRSEVYSFEVAAVKMQIITGVSNRIMEFNTTSSAAELAHLQHAHKNVRSLPSWTVWFYEKMGINTNPKSLSNGTQVKENSNQKPEASAESTSERSQSLSSVRVSTRTTYRILLEDREGTIYEFYSFQDLSMARRMYLRIQTYLQVARTEGDNIHLDLDYDDSYWDESGAVVFALMLLGCLWVPYLELVAFDSSTGVVRLEHKNLLRLTRRHYTCALENIARAEVTAVTVYDVVAGRTYPVRQSLRPQQEHGLRLVLSRKLEKNTKIIEHVGGVDVIQLGFGFTTQDDGSLRCIVEAVNDMLLTYAREENCDQSLPSPTNVENDEENAASSTSNFRKCCICTQRNSRVVLFPCKHFNTCIVCSEFLTLCPICRKPVEERHTVYF